MTTYKDKSHRGAPLGIILRSLLLALLLAGWSCDVWGQTGTNYSGIYYFINCGSGKTNPDDPKIEDIADEADYFYLVPADAPKQANNRDAWYSSSDTDGDSAKPYLTTYRTNKDAAEIPDGVTERPHNSVWIVKFASNDSGTDYYYLIHAATGKYVVHEAPFSGNYNRKSVHLLATDSPGENAEFAITATTHTTTYPTRDGYYNFRPKSRTSGNRFLNASNRNFNYYYSHSKTKDSNVVDYYEGLIGLYKNKNNDGANDASASDWVPVATLLDAPTITMDAATKKITVTDSNGLPAGYSIRYTFSSDGVPAAPTASTPDITDGELTNGAGTYKVAIERYGMLLTEIKTIKLVLNPTINITPVGGYTYDGTEKEPVVSVLDGEETIAVSEYDVTYSNNTNAGTATVTIKNKAGGNYLFFYSTTFTINPASLTISADALTKGYGDSDPALTYTPTGIAAGDDVADVLTGVLAREAGENVGTYAISQGTLESVSTNYTIGTFTPANFTITQKSIGNGTIPAAGITCDITRNNDDSFTVTVDNNGNAMTVGTSGTDYDYSLSTTGDASTKYYEVEATGANNYTGSFKVKYANAPFGTHDATNYSATFITDATGDEDYATPAGMTACIITDVDVATGVVTVETLDYIPENVPVVLLSDHAATGFFIQPRVVGGSDITSSQVSSNLLAVARGDDATRTFAVAEIYLLYKDEFVLNTAGTLPAERVYLPVAAIGGAPAKLGIDWDCITGITTPVDPSATTVPIGFANGIWYTLDGRRVSGKPTQRGLYISNGQKVVVK